ncbi:Metalloenzyme, LuxS/M16 peptidase-like protein [Pseudocohnilembus persalinus]|uniref:Metalloenzyme, LuxS/M16 peptidase-like protein n=1 Tax=Pseudocohnilembus persalinus TaxID=266149 RepID=A0A0V0QXM1_PSEPJ|nr:Metalloenzyme, LuxS/M16 peptidase-like protein [Pseudocohnilembus persalinus]|eukprot:KRX07100.1 Metalloenzyme, LuxS/M16 peptidase-like protein [Pseudocohnilembus persalinus]
MLKKINLKKQSTIFSKNLKNKFYFSRGIERQTYENLKEGDEIHNFVIKKIEQIPDFQLTGYYLEHKKLGTQFLHIDTPDQNNCMAIIFKTLPNNDKGTPHILEHLACCGGEKFPVRDPFMKMLKRSLNTYMNAWTGPDFTAYPFSSQNEQDFKNLMNVYADISLRSLLKETDFRQEGWRYDVDADGNLTYKGVVFNEMKGVFQTQDSVLAEEINKRLYKGSIYSNCSGGIPSDITDLSYEEVKDFYNTYYHPSNTKIFSYGDLNFQEHLKYLDKNYFSTDKFQKHEAIKPLPKIEKFKEPLKDLTFYGPPESHSLDEGSECKFGFTFLCNQVTENPIETLGLQVLSYLLFQTPNGPLYKNLIEAGLAPAFISGNGYESYQLEGAFTIGVQGISEESIEQIEQIIFETLKNEVEFDEELIESVLHTMELDSKVPKSNFGLNILMQVLNPYNHDAEKPLAFLDVTNNIKTIKEKILDENYLKTLTEKYLLNNNHYLRYKMLPKQSFNQELKEQENQKLQRKQKEISQEELEKIKQINEQLKKEQEEEEDNTDLLPTLSTKDIDTNVEKISIKQEKIQGIPLNFTQQQTNGLTYLRMKVNMQDVPLFIRQYLEVFQTIITQIGTQKYKKEKFNTLLNLYTSGFNVYFESSMDKNDPSKVNNFMVFSVACINRNIEKMVELFREIVCTPNFHDYDHMVTLIRNASTQLSQNIVDSSLTYAFSTAHASLREKYYVNEQLNQARFLCSIGKNMGKEKFKQQLYMQDIEFQMNSIMYNLMRKPNIEFMVHSDSESNYQDMKFQLIRLIDGMNFSYKSFESEVENTYFDEQQHPNPFQQNFARNYYTLPMQVNYCVQSFQAPSYNNPLTPKYQLLSEILSNKFLHREIREKGGAYGGGSKFADGVLSFYSYRDPNSSQTLKSFNDSIKYISETKITENDLDEAKLCIFQRIGKPITPQNKGLGKFLHNITEEDKINYRQALIQTNPSDLKDVIQQLIEEQAKGQYSQVIFGSEENEELNSFKEQNWNIEKALK